MRAIERQMKLAVQDKRNWRLSNTAVYYISAKESGNFHGARSSIFLHNNHIADYWHESQTLDVDVRTLARFQTNVTKSRLRALGADVTTKAGRTYLNGCLVTYE